MCFRSVSSGSQNGFVARELGFHPFRCGKRFLGRGRPLGGPRNIGADGAGRPDEQEDEARRLRELCNAGILSVADYYLLFRTRIIGESLRGYAAKVGLSYEAARKRRQRAEEATHWQCSHGS